VRESNGNRNAPRIRACFDTPMISQNPIDHRSVEGEQ